MSPGTDVLGLASVYLPALWIFSKGKGTARRGRGCLWGFGKQKPTAAPALSCKVTRDTVTARSALPIGLSDPLLQEAVARNQHWEARKRRFPDWWHEELRGGEGEFLHARICRENGGHALSWGKDWDVEGGTADSPGH